jgi:PAS domain S-box-containing protein
VTEVKEAEAALRASEERLRLVVSSATDYAIFTLDSDRRITGWSPGSEAVFGYVEAEVLGGQADILFTPEDRAAGVPQEEVRTALRDGRAADERWHTRKDGSRFFASGVLTRLGDDGSLGLVKVLRDLTDRKRMEDTLREAYDELESRVTERTAELSRANEARLELLRRLVRAQEDERRRVSRELHDGLGQELTAMILDLKALEESIPKGSPGRERLQEVEASVARIGRGAHDLAVELRPTALDDIGLDPALATYVTRWSERTGVAADFQALGLDGDRLPPEIETAIYRVVQEAMNNVAKHAEASRVSVILERRRDEVTGLV